MKQRVQSSQVTFCHSFNNLSCIERKRIWLDTHYFVFHQMNHILTKVGVTWKVCHHSFVFLEHPVQLWFLLLLYSCCCCCTVCVYDRFGFTFTSLHVSEAETGTVLTLTFCTSSSRRTLSPMTTLTDTVASVVLTSGTD